ncbi:hypothetical protein EON65_39435 [archaeon]|nr:MAG: hypothetical protein EON65_39435 [archaeon]
MVILALSLAHGKVFGSKSGVGGRTGVKSAELDSIEEVQHELATFLHRNGRRNDVIGKYEIEEVSRTISALMNVQKAVKTMDGATHQLRNTFKERYGVLQISLMLQHVF